MFIAIVSYLAPRDQVAAQREAHRSFLDTLFRRDLLLASGPKKSGDGGVLVVRDGIQEKELNELLARDPFVTSGVARYDLVEFDAVKQASILKG
ncbi:GTP cyclohydrolase [Saccharibacter sp. 17.LH.SD]|uniref:YciI family protein n=1 Tax=Saccharibacter sp. 17.LH.SD TaxID=2689393 RepID=UPI00136FCBDC|nr:YciI family protein [Saccharibacter sp. 17.LH.SD]MXV45033.1 GTP cyclohydrolase [Saccharibacter sp. 17.LH.SD]